MFVLKKLLIKKIIFDLLLIIGNSLEHNLISDRSSDNLIEHNRIYVAEKNHKHNGQTNFKPIYIYSTALSDSKTLTRPINNINEVEYKKKKKNQLIGKLENNHKLYNNSNSVSNDNNNNNRNDIFENMDYDTLIQVLDNDNHTITSLLVDYIFEYGNTFTGVNGYKNNVNDSSSSEINYFTVYDVQEQMEGRGNGKKRRGQQPRTKHIKVKKKFKKFMLPLLLAYKLKFFALIPIMISGLVLLTGATGLAGFFFALFAAVMGLKSKHHK